MIEVTYVDHMGSDLSVVNAARVSFGKKSDWMPRVHNGEQLVLTPKDAKLISYLADITQVSVQPCVCYVPYQSTYLCSTSATEA